MKGKDRKTVHLLQPGGDSRPEYLPFLCKLTLTHETFSYSPAASACRLPAQRWLQLMPQQPVNYFQVEKAYHEWTDSVAAAIPSNSILRILHRDEAEEMEKLSLLRLARWRAGRSRSITPTAPCAGSAVQARLPSTSRIRISFMRLPQACYGARRITASAGLPMSIQQNISRSALFGWIRFMAILCTSFPTDSFLNPPTKDTAGSSW